MQPESVSALYRLIALFACFCCAIYTVKLTTIIGKPDITRGQFWTWTMLLFVFTAICVAWTFWLLFINWSLQSADSVFAYIFAIRYLIPSVILIFLVNLIFLASNPSETSGLKNSLAFVATGLWCVFMATVSPIILIQFNRSYEKASEPRRIAFNNQRIIDMAEEARLLNEYTPSEFSSVNLSTHPYEYKGDSISGQYWMKWADAHGNLQEADGSWLSNGLEAQQVTDWKVQTKLMLERIDKSLDEETYSVYLGEADLETSYLNNSYIHYRKPVVIADGGDHILGFEITPIPRIGNAAPQVQICVFTKELVANIAFLKTEFALKDFDVAIEEPLLQLIEFPGEPE